MSQINYSNISQTLYYQHYKSAIVIFKDNPYFSVYQTNSFSADLGFLILPISGLQIGLAVDNLIPANVSVTSTDTDRVPTKIRLGVAYALNSIAATIQQESLQNIFKLMKPSSILVNISRGSVINEIDLLEETLEDIFQSALNSGFFSIASFIILTSVVSTFYYIRLIKSAYFESSHTEWAFYAPLSANQGVVITLSFFGIIFLFYNPLLLNLLTYKMAFSLFL